MTLSQHEAVVELAAIKKAISTSDWAALEVYGCLNPAIQRASVLDAARGDPSAVGSAPHGGGSHDRATLGPPFAGHGSRKRSPGGTHAR